MNVKYRVYKADANDYRIRIIYPAHGPFRARASEYGPFNTRKEAQERLEKMEIQNAERDLSSDRTKPLV